MLPTWPSFKLHNTLLHDLIVIENSGVLITCHAILSRTLQKYFITFVPFRINISLSQYQVFLMSWKDNEQQWVLSSGSVLPRIQILFDQLKWISLNKYLHTGCFIIAETCFSVHKIIIFIILFFCQIKIVINFTNLCIKDIMLSA